MTRKGTQSNELKMKCIMASSLCSKSGGGLEEWTNIVAFPLNHTQTKSEKRVRVGGFYVLSILRYISNTFFSNHQTPETE